MGGGALSDPVLRPSRTETLSDSSSVVYFADRSHCLVLYFSEGRGDITDLWSTKCRVIEGTIARVCFRPVTP